MRLAGIAQIERENLRNFNKYRCVNSRNFLFPLHMTRLLLRDLAGLPVAATGTFVAIAPNPRRYAKILRQLLTSIEFFFPFRCGIAKWPESIQKWIALLLSNIFELTNWGFPARGGKFAGVLVFYFLCFVLECRAASSAARLGIWRSSENVVEINDSDCWSDVLIIIWQRCKAFFKFYSKFTSSKAKRKKSI